MSGLFFGGFAGAGVITVSSNWDSPTGASPQTTATRTLTVPADNSGMIAFSITGTGAGSVTYSKNGGGFISVSDGEGIIFANSDTLAFKLTGASRAAQIALVDQTTRTPIGGSTITNT